MFKRNLLPHSVCWNYTATSRQSLIFLQGALLNVYKDTLILDQFYIGRYVELMHDISGINNTSSGSYPHSRYTKGTSGIRYMFIKIHSAACSVHVYQVTVCKRTQHYANITVQKHLHTPATFQHVSVVATTTITREDNSKDQRTPVFKLSCHTHTDLFRSPVNTQSIYTSHVCTYVHSVGSICR
jgi:hypothetical protein